MNDIREIDYHESIKELKEPIDKSELDLLLYEWKLYLYSLSRYTQNTRLKDIPYYGGN